MSGVARFVATRLVLAVLTLVVISAITFFATNVIPGDPARIALGKGATSEQLQAYDRQQGLDQPVATRYVHWVANAVRGRWGTSVLSQQTVTSLVVPRIGRTVLLGFLAMLVAVPVAFILGVYSAQRSGRPVDGAISFSALFINSLPEFVVAITLLVVLGVELGLLPDRVQRRRLRQHHGRGQGLRPAGAHARDRADPVHDAHDPRQRA